MKVPFALLLLCLAASATPAQAQCGSSRGGGHANHGSSPDHRNHQESPTNKVQATNTVCPVMGRPVKPGRDREVVVRENYYLVCCDGCGPEMSENYDKYLDKEGRPLNTPSKDEKAPAKKDEKPAPPAPPTHEGHQH